MRQSVYGGAKQPQSLAALRSRLEMLLVYERLHYPCRTIHQAHPVRGSSCSGFDQHQSILLQNTIVSCSTILNIFSYVQLGKGHR